MVWCLSTSKKSMLRRWVSRWRSRVSMLAMETVALTDESRTLSPISMVPSNSVNVPRTLLTMRWRTVKPTTEWLWGRARVLAALIVAALTLIPLAAATAADAPTPTAATNQVLKVDAGYAGLYVPGRFVPIRVTVRADRLVRGRLQATIIAVGSG